MSYRGLPKKRPVLCDVTSYSNIHLINGASAEFAIPCYYNIAPRVEGCGASPAGVDDLIPILLLDEGYTYPVIAFDEQPAGLTYEAWIDPDDQHIIRIVLDAKCPSAVSEVVTCKMSLLATRKTHGRRRTDVVLRGTIRIEPSPITYDVYEGVSVVLEGAV